MANIVLKTFAAGDEGQGTVTPQDDSLIYQNAVSVNGIFGGATVTLTGANTLHVASGLGIICGRFFEINESDISVQLSSSGTLSGRLKIHLDLNNADNPIEIVTETGATLPALSGDSNININGGAFDMELCTFSVNELTISSLVNTFPTIDNTSKQIRRKTAYAVNDFVLCQSASDALIFICTTAGTTAIQEPKAYTTVTDGNTVTDGTAVFKAVSVSGQITKLSKTEDLISNSGDAYDPTKAYGIGNYVIHDDTLYRCTTACSAGSWETNQSCFTTDTLVNVASNCYNYTTRLLRNSLGDLNSDSAIEAAILSFAVNYMGNYITYPVSFNMTVSGTRFGKTQYVGFVTRFSTTRVTVRYIRGNSTAQMLANYNNGTWTYE